MVVKTILTVIIIAHLSVLAFFALVGALFLYNVNHAPTTAENCPRVVRYEDDTLACIVPMQAEDDNIMIVRGE